MKHLFLFLLFLLPVLLSAQDPLPANPRKLRLGYQTDGEGIVLYGSGVPSYTPTRYRSAFHYMDTTNNIYYQYNRIEAKWDTILAGAGAVADGVSVDNSTWSKIGGTDVQQALTKTDSVLNNITVDGSQIQNKFEATTTTLTVSADTLEAKSRYVIKAVTPDTATVDKAIYLPDPSTIDSISTFRIVAEDGSEQYDFYIIDTFSNIISRGNGKWANRYYLDDGEDITLTTNGTYWIIASTNYSTPLDWVAKKRIDVNESFPGYESRHIPKVEEYTQDSVTLLIKKNKAPWGENLFKRSQNIQQFPYWNHVSNSVQLVQNVAYAPNGELQVDRMIALTANPELQYRPSSGCSSDCDLYEPNTTYTISAWVSVPDGQTSTFYFLLPNSTISTPDTIFTITNTELQRVSTTFTTNGSVGAREVTSFHIGENDTLNIWNPQLERTPIVSPTISTTRDVRTNQDTVWVETTVNKGELAYSNSNSLGALKVDDRDVLIKQMDYCRELEECVVNVIDQDITLTDSVVVKENTNITMRGNGFNTIFIDVNSPTKSGLVIGDPSVGYNKYIELRNLDIEALSECFALVKAYSTLEVKYDNIILNGGSATRYAHHGYYENFPIGAPDFRSINVRINNFEIRNCDTAMVSNFQRSAKLDNAYFIDNGWGHFIVSGGGFYSTLYHVEAIDNSAMVATGATNINIEKLQGERYNEAGNDFPAFDIEKCDRFAINSADVGAWAASGDTVTVFKLDTVEVAIITNLRGFVNGATNNPVSTTNQTETLWWANNNLSGAGGGFRLDSIDDNTLLYLLNTPSQKSRVPEQFIDDAIVSTSVVDSNMIFSSSIIDTLLSHDIVIQSGKRNEAGRSDINSGGTQPWNTVNYNEVKNYEASPNEGGVGADLLIRTANGSLRFNQSLDPGRYLISFYVKKTPTYSGTSITLSEVGPVESVEGFNYFESIPLVDTLEFQRIARVMEIGDPDVGGSGRFDVDFNGQAIGDSIIFADFVLTKVGKAFSTGETDYEYKAYGESNTLDYDTIKWKLLDALQVEGRLVKLDSFQTNVLVDTDGDVGTAGQLFSSTGIGTDWVTNPAFDGGSLYITDADPDTLDFSASGGIYQQIQDLQATALDNFTALSDSLIYGRSLTRPFTLNFSVTVEGDTGSTFYNLEVKRNGTAITGCRVSEEYPSAGVEQNISGSCRVDLGNSDALTLEIMTPSASSQVIARKANLTVH